jgi:HSP20 family molecular chaperone IbpA
MSRNTENSKSYEDIVRQTVMDPDSSQRPTRAQERAAREGFRAMDADETQLHQRVAQTLAGVPGMAGVSVEVTRELVTLRGSVSAADSLRTLEDIVAAVPGVNTVHNQVVVS